MPPRARCVVASLVVSETPVLTWGHVARGAWRMAVQTNYSMFTDDTLYRARDELRSGNHLARVLRNAAAASKRSRRDADASSNGRRHRHRHGDHGGHGGHDDGVHDGGVHDGERVEDGVEQRHRSCSGGSTSSSCAAAHEAQRLVTVKRTFERRLIECRRDYARRCTDALAHADIQLRTQSAVPCVSPPATAATARRFGPMLSAIPGVVSGAVSVFAASVFPF